MKKSLFLPVLAVMVALGAGGAWADGPFPTQMTDGSFGPAGQVTPNSNTGEVEVYNALNSLLGTSFSNNGQADNLEVHGNTSTWTNNGNGGYAIIGLGAAASNTVAVYNTATPNNLVNPLGGFTGNGLFGDGSNGNPYIGTGPVFSSGTQFGFALSENFNGVTTAYRSDPTLNPDKMDHMLVYNLSALNGKQVFITDANTGQETAVTLNNPYLLSFEDSNLSNNGAPGANGVPSDMDYNDLMVLINGAAPVGSAPVPEPMTVGLMAAGLLAMAGIGFNRKFAL